MLARRDASSLTPADIEALIEAVGNENEAVQEAAAWRLLGVRDDKDKLVLDRLYDKRPKVTRRTKPAYPQEARERGIRGRVELQFVVNNAGRVGHVRVLRSIPVPTTQRLRAFASGSSSRHCIATKRRHSS
jgi:hypothetical protein